MITYAPELDIEEDNKKIFHYYRTPKGLIDIEPTAPGPNLPEEHPLRFGSYKYQSTLMQNIVIALLKSHDPTEVRYILSQIIKMEKEENAQV